MPILRNSLLAALVNARVVMQLPVSFHVKENQLHKGRYIVWLALHQVLAGKLCYTFIYIHLLGATIKLSMLFQVLGLLVHLKEYSS